MSASDGMQPDVPPESPQPKMPWWEFARRVLATDVGLSNRVLTIVALLAMTWAVEDGFWWTVAAFIFWGFLMQSALLDSFLNGFLAGKKFAEHEQEELRGDLPSLPISVLVDFCQKHSIPPQEIERLIWGERP